MPSPLLRSLAKRAGVSIETAEEKWAAAKALAARKGRTAGDHYWGAVTAITKSLLGIKENLTFSEYLEEARKKEISASVDWGAEHTGLRHVQTLTWSINDRLQLFVPKRRNPTVQRERETEMRLRSVRKELDEERPPVLTSYRDSPPGNDKPAEGFWTSSAWETKTGWTSDWYRFVQRRFPEWQTDYGYLFEVDKSAQVFDLFYADDFFQWAESHDRVLTKTGDWPPADSPDNMRVRFPWDEMAKLFDGAHHSGGGYGRYDEFTYGWDVESTVWFNTSVLKYKGAVPLDSGIEDDE